MDKIKLAIVGVHGLPAKYGGYCTLAEYLAMYQPDDFDVTVYAVRTEYKEHPAKYKYVNLVWVDYPANGGKAMLFHNWSIRHAIKHGADCIILCGSSGGFTLPFFRKHRDKFFLNIGGIEWKRNKYNWAVRQFTRFLMRCAANGSGYLIADNIGMQDYYVEEYGRHDSRMIPYGGDQAQTEALTSEVAEKYPFLNGDYAVAVARIQSDNNTEMLLEAFKDAKMPLVYIGNWNVSEWAMTTREKYSKYPNLHLLDAIYEIHELNQIRSNCSLYIHGHSAGGTNPSLVEAMFLGVPLACFDNGFNNNTTYSKALYFKDVESLKALVANTSAEEFNKVAHDMKSLAMEHYTWEKIAEQYYDFFRNKK